MSTHKELLKHSRNYLFANIATKALAFISIPVYTRLMTVEEYGVVNVLLSVLNIAPILLTLNLEVAISRYYYDTKDIEDFKRFVGCSIRLVVIAFIVTSVIFVLLLPLISSLLAFSTLLTLTILPISLYRITNSIFQQIYNPILQSKKIAIVSSVQTYLAFGLSVIAILCLPSNKYYGFVIGNLVAMMLLGIYMYRQIIPYFTNGWSREHILYIAKYCLPYIPYSLSGVIIDQLGRIFISNDSGFELAGLYSMAANIATIIAIFIGVVHQAWNPYYFKYLNEKDHKSLDTDYDIIWRITMILVVGISVFGRELGYILGGSKYLHSLYILPVLCVGYAFYQWAYVYMRNTGYAKQTIWNGVVVTLSGILNIYLVAILTGPYKELGVAIAFAASYALLMILSWLVNRLFLNVYTPPFSNFLIVGVFSLPFAVYGMWTYFKEQSFVSFTIKIVVFCVFVGVVSKKYLHMIPQLIKR